MDKMTKYKNYKVKIDGIKFDSVSESKYYTKLKSDKESGVIASFDLQPKYILQEKFKFADENIRAIEYIADFVITHNDGIIEVVDVKGMATPVALIKRKMFLKTHPHLLLSWIVYVKKYGGWVDFFELQKLRKKNKK